MANIGWRRGECKRRRGKSPPCGEETTAVVRLAGAEVAKGVMDKGNRGLIEDICGHLRTMSAIAGGGFSLRMHHP